MGISGVIVVLNEQKVLRRALENLQRFTNEIVLVDSHSTDDTLKIAAEYNCRIFQRDFDNHRDQKNFAIEQCKSEWIFLLDADDGTLHSLRPSGKPEEISAGFSIIRLRSFVEADACHVALGAVIA